MSPQVPGGGVDLSGAGRVPLRSQSILFPAGLDVVASGVAQPGCNMALRVIDLLDGRCMFVPVSAQFARQLAAQLTETADAMEAKHGQAI